MARQPKPEAGDYLENGTRLVRVMGYDRRGGLIVEDALTEAVETMAVSLLAGWRRVKRRKVGVG